MNYKKKYLASIGYTPICYKGCTSFENLQFGIIELNSNMEVSFDTEENETALIVLEGTISIRFDNIFWTGLGTRKNVFDGAAAAAYLPRKKKVRISSATHARIAVCATLAFEDGAPKRIDPSDVKRLLLGVKPWERETHFIIDSDCGSKRLFVGEALVTPGNWAGFPPHKHDVDDMPDEDIQEELYYFQFSPPQGFGLQCMYSKDGEIDVCYKILNNDLVEFPRGYHTFVGAPGYSTYFLWVSSVRNPGMFRSQDPDHAWVSALENHIRKQS